MAESTKSEISHVIRIVKDKALMRFILVSVTLYLVATGLGIYDIYTDWEVVVRFHRNGFNHPLLPLDFNWLRAWYFFTVFGTIFTTLSLLNESVHIFYSMWLFCAKCCGKSFKCFRKVNEENRLNSFEMKEPQPVSEREKEIVDSEKEVEEGQNKVSTDACKYCYDYGWNFTTRGQTIGNFNFWLQHFPLLVLAFLYATSQTTCKTPEKKDVSGDLLAVARSAFVTAASASFKWIRVMVQLCASLALRMKSKKEFEKKGKCGKVFSKVLSEKGDAIYPPDTCAQYCFIPFFFILLFEFALVILAFVLSAIMSSMHLQVSSFQNFESSLAIFRNQSTRDSVHLLNISNNIIPASNGSFLSFETIQDVHNNETIHCLTEFEYRQEEFDIFFNSIEVEAISDEGEFCAVKIGSDAENNKTYSRCTPYYTMGGYVLFYGYTSDSGLSISISSSNDNDPDPNYGIIVDQQFTFASSNSFFRNNKIRRFDEECSVLRNGYPHIRTGPAVDLGIQVEKRIDRTDHLNSSQPLLILFVNVENSTTTVLFNVSVADIVAQSMGLSCIHTFQEDPSDEVMVTYHTHFQYDYARKQVMYNAREATNLNSVSCKDRCDSQLPNKLNMTGLFVYGYYDEEIEDHQLLTSCSNIPFQLLIPRHDPKLSVDCC